MMKGKLLTVNKIILFCIFAGNFLKYLFVDYSDKKQSFVD